MNKNRFTSDGSEIVLSQCQLCQHVAAGTAWTCSAFPKGIPNGIITNDLDHRQPIAGDGGVRFAPKPGTNRGALDRLNAVLDAVE